MSLAAQAQSIPQSITVEGRLYDAGNPMGAGQANELVNFKLEVLVEGTSCILYSEEHVNIDVAGSNTAAGFFALPLGSGTSVVNPLGSFAKVFSNSENVSAIAGCTAVTLTTQRRLVRIHVNQASAGATYATLSPDTVLTSVPTAMIAETSQSTNSFGGKTAAGFVQTNTTGSNVLSQTNVESIFETNNFGRLQNLLNATAVNLGNRPITGVSDPTNASDAATKNYADTKLTGLPVALVDVGVGTGTGKVLTWNGSAWTATTPALSGAAGGDLTGTYPNPTVANLAIGTSKLADGSVTSAKINTTGIAKNRILITDSTTGATVSYATCSANEVLKFTSAALGWECTPVASIAPVASVNGQTGAVVLTGANLGLGSASMRNIGIGTSNVPEILATGKLDPAIIPSLSGDLTGTAPNLFVARLQGRQIAATLPSTGHILQWNGSQWEPAAPAVSGITALNGDVTAAGPGLTAATITNGAITTPKVFSTPGANRLVATDNTSGATLVPFVCSIDETMKWTASGWACATVNSMLGSQVIVDGGNTRGAAIVVGTKDNFDFNIKTNETTRLSIAANGNVGIGGTPSRRLHVYGVMRLDPAALPSGAAGDVAIENGTNALKYHNGTSWVTVGAGTGDFKSDGTVPMTGNLRTNGRFVSNDGDNEGVYVTTTGNVGIGNSSPAAKLEITGSARATSLETSLPGTAGVALVHSASTGITDSNLWDWYQSPTSLTLRTANDSYSSMSPVMKIGRSGATPSYVSFPIAKVGFGTSTPQAQLSVGSFSPGLFESNSPGLIQIAGPADINDAPNGLEFKGGLGAAGYGWKIVAPDRSAGNIPLSFASRENLAAWTERVTMLNNGNVGIGTTSPARKLEVNGLLRLSPSALPAGAAGDITLDAAAGNALKYHNGTAWQTLGTGTGDFLAAGTVPMTGAFRSVAGTAGSPGMSFVGDTDNGFYAPAADNLAIVNGGLETIRFANGGNIGVGVTNPTNLLDLRKDQGSQTGIVLTNKSGSSSAHAAYVLQNDGAGRAYFDVGSSSATGNYMNRMSIGVDGAMNGVNLVSEYVGGDFRFFIGGISTANEKMRLQSNGALGLGVTSPLRLLHVAGPIRIAPSTMPSSPSAGDIAVDSTASNSLKFHNGTSWQSLGTGDFLANGTVAMTGNIRLNNNWLSNDGGGEGIRVDNSGNVGIGTTAPTSLLHVGYAAGGTQVAQFEGSVTMRMNMAGEPTVLTFTNLNGTTTGTAMEFLGNVGGTPKNLVRLTATQPTTGNGNFVISTANSNSYVERVRVDQNGNVGIGVTAPAVKLDIAGAIRLAGDSSTCSAAIEGTQRYDSTNKRMELCNGTSWVGLSPRRIICQYESSTYVVSGGNGTIQKYEWTTGDCTPSLPIVGCVGHISKSIQCSSAMDWAVLSPNESYSTYAPTLTIGGNGGMAWYKNASGSCNGISLRAVYLCPD